MATDDAAVFAREAQHGAPRRPPALPHTLAWAVATGWREQLPPLQLDTNAADGVFIPSYEWLHWQLAAASTAAPARATVTAWFWVSSCDGYSGEENPRFWKRVLSEFQRHDDTHAPPMSDAIRFFDRPGRAFPRVRIETHDFSIVQAFTGKTPTPLDAVINRQLGRMFQRLEAYLVRERLQRPIPLSIQSRDLELVLRHKSDNRLVPRQAPDAGSAVLLRLRERCESDDRDAFLHALAAELAAEPQTNQPVFQVDSAYIPTWSWKLSPQLRDRSLQSRGLDVEEVKSGSDWRESTLHGSSGHAASQLRLHFGIGAPASSRRVRLALQHRPLPSSLLAAVCSALPHAQSVSALHMSLYRSTSEDSLDWAWLGYSLFHPDASRSACVDLNLFVELFSAHAVRMLQLMAQGNNLAHAESPTQLPPSTSYYSAELLDQTEIRRYPSLAAPVVLRHTLATERFCVDNAASLDDWVRVVVPGFGFGWVPSPAVVSVVSRPPGQSRLQRLSLRSAVGAPVHHAYDVVRAVGQRLTRLDLVACGDLQAETLLRLLLGCPALKTLRVCHDGSLWGSSPNLLLHQHQDNLPLLEEISLSLVDYTLRLGHHRHASLRRLSALRVVALPAHENFPRNRDTLLAFLQAHPSIEYLHWSDPNGADASVFYNRNAYPGRRQRSHQQVGELSHPLGSSGLCLACRFAVVSAVHASRSTAPASALAGLDQDLLSLVFSFSPRCGLRDLWIGP